jgi:peptide/nickel transport system ATP-binding protein/oligopeptide transport system ATP-binding protein
VPRLSEYPNGHVAACHFPLNVTEDEVRQSTKSPLSPLNSGDTQPTRVEDADAPLRSGVATDL